MEHADCRNNAGNCWASEWMQKSALLLRPWQSLYAHSTFSWSSFFTFISPSYKVSKSASTFCLSNLLSLNFGTSSGELGVAWKARNKRDSPTSTRMSQKYPAVPTACQEFQVWGARTASLATAPSAELPSVFSRIVNQRNITPTAPSIQGGSQSTKL